MAVMSGIAPVADSRPRPAIAVVDLIRVYQEADIETIALRGVNLEVAHGEFVAVMGRSGSGKSTLLGLLAGSDRPTAGRVVIDDVDISRATEDERATVRGRRVGVVFQNQNLVPFLSLLENVQLAATLAGTPLDRPAAQAILARVGLEDRAAHRPTELSGGEQQRAAVALVLGPRPSIILADEITGELDSANAALVVGLLQEVHRVDGVTIVLATHDPDVAAATDRIVELRDGQVIADRRLA